MTRDQIITFLRECRERMQAIHDGLGEERSTLNETEQAEWDTIRGWVDDATAALERLDRIEAIATGDAPGRAIDGAGIPAPHVQRDTGDPFERFDPLATNAELRGQAQTAIERLTDTPDDVRETLAQAVTRLPARGVADRLLLTASETYRSAFWKMAQGKRLTEREEAVFERAQSLTNNAGGFAVPFTLDPTVLLTNDGTANPVRQLANVVQITTDQWNGVSSAGVTASWDGEVGEVSDDAMTLAQPSIDVEKAQAFVPFSIEVGEDWAQLEAEVRQAFMDAKDRLEATAFINGAGSGSNQPTGIITELDGGASEVSPATAETFAVADVYATLSALPPRYRRTRDQASWLAHLGTMNQVRQFDSAGGSSFWANLTADQPERLLGYRIFEASDMDNSDDINAAATADNHLLVIGDWKRYVVVDRVGLSVEFIPHLFATGNNRPSGQRGLYAYWRVGAGSVDDNAFRVLNVATTA